MTPGLTIAITYSDVDCVAVEITARNDRFAGSTRAWAGYDELAEFAEHIAGFPKDASDRRVYEFGMPGSSTAGGFCRLDFQCPDRAGHISLDVVLEGDEMMYAPASAHLSVPVEAAGIDVFVQQLRGLNRDRRGVVTLPAVCAAV